MAGRPVVSSAADASSSVCAMAERGLQPQLRHGVAEFEPVLRLVDRRRVRADQLHAVLRQRAVAVERQRGVERRLPAHGGQHRVRPLALAMMEATTAGVIGST